MGQALPKLSSAHLEALELVEVPMWLVEVGELRFAWANAAGLELWRRPSVEALTHVAWRAKRCAATRTQFDHLEARCRDGEVVHARLMLYPDDAPVAVRIVLREIRRDGDPQPYLLVEARADAEAASDDARRALSCLSQTPAAAIMFDLHGAPLWANDGARYVFAPRPGGGRLEEVWVHEGDHRQLLERLANDLTWAGEVEVQTRYGPRWNLVDARVSTDPATGSPAYLLGFVDIHRFKGAELALREAKEAAEEASRSKSAFLANMSHEIRTPMNGVLGALQVLRQSTLEDAQQHMVDTIQRSARTLLAILNDILDLSRIEAGKLQVESIEFDLVRTLEDVVELHAAAAATKDLALEVTLDNEIPGRVYGDPVRLSQVLGNFVSNAIKFTERGRVDIALRTRRQDGDVAYVELEVRDTGCGISKEAQQRVFSAFEQADRSMTRRFGGTGLGLTISKQLVDLMGGEVGLESELGEGSTFWLALPLPLRGPLLRSEDLASGALATASLPPPSLSEVRVLLVEDNAINREVAEAMLRSLDCVVDTAGNGYEALERLAEPAARYDLVLMDCQMPVMDGFTATMGIRAREPRGHRRLPVIALTANAMEGDRERCLEVGMDDFVAKPFALPELARTMRRCLTSARRAEDLTSGHARSGAAPHGPSRDADGS